MEAEFGPLPRDSQGNHSLPAGTLVASGDTILVSQHNPAMADISASLTNSLDRGGSGGMRAPLRMNGFPVKGAAAGVDPDDLVTLSQIGSGGGMPVGAILDYAGATAPAGWMLCGGQSLNRADFPELFAAIGTAFGSASATTFSLPDLRGRVVAGIDFDVGGLAGRLTEAATIDGNARGAAGGSQRHTLTTEQMPSHTHTLSGSTSSAGSHSHVYSGASPGGGGSGGGGWDAAFPVQSATDTAGAHTHTLSGTAASAGGGQAHPIVQPTIVLNKIIRVGNN